MTLDKIAKIAEATLNHWEICLVLLLSLVEVSKIKINPWSALFRWIGDMFMSGIKSDIADIKTELNAVKDDVIEMKKESRESEAKAARTRILRCSDEVYQGVKHSKEYFDNILSDITSYNRYCSENPHFRNEVTVIASKRIKDVYKRCLEERDFL